MSAPLPVNILCGYLGAGKTTLLNRLLSQGQERVLVMVNDFGDIAVDAALISGRSADTIQLSNGCICCSFGGGLFEAFERALGYRGQVDRLVIEASGVAEPMRLAAFAQAEPELSCMAVVTVIDPETIGTRLADPRIRSVVQRQIEGADIFYLSRADHLASETLDDAEALACHMNPAATFFRQMDDAFLNELHRPHDPLLSSGAGRQNHADIFARRSFVLDTAPDRAGFLELLGRFSNSLHRLKGFVKFSGQSAPELVELAGGRLSTAHAPHDGGSSPVRLVVIAPEAAILDRFEDEVRRAFGPPPSGHPALLPSDGPEPPCSPHQGGWTGGVAASAG